jgi:hypothetical protein
LLPLIPLGEKDRLGDLPLVSAKQARSGYPTALGHARLGFEPTSKLKASENINSLYKIINCTTFLFEQGVVNPDY